MNYASISHRLMSKYSLRTSLMIMKDLSVSDVENLLNFMRNLSYLQQIKEELKRLAADKQTKSIQRLIDRKIKTLQAFNHPAISH